MDIRQVAARNSRVLFVVFLFAIAGLTVLTLTLPGCQDPPSQPAHAVVPALLPSPTGGEGFLAEALDEVDAIAAWGGGSNVVRGGAAKVEADSVFIYGEVTPDGFGAVVTERHAYPKGLLLITVRRSFGRNGRLVSESKQYISEEARHADLPQQTVLTEIIALVRDTIVTHVMRNGILETYTFRLPVVSEAVNATAQTVRITTRFARGGSVVSEVTDGSGALVRRTITTPLGTGALETRTEYPDGSWRVATTLGQADGSILRKITTGG